MITVSMKGSHRATRPSVIGSLVLTLAWAMGAEPMPASLEKAARRKPCSSTPIMPPCTPSGENAPTTIWVMASVMCSAFTPITTRPASR